MVMYRCTMVLLEIISYSNIQDTILYEKLVKRILLADDSLKRIHMASLFKWPAGPRFTRKTGENKSTS